MEEQVAVSAEILPEKDTSVESSAISVPDAIKPEDGQPEVVQIIMEQDGTHSLEVGAQLIQLDTGQGQLQQYLQVSAGFPISTSLLSISHSNK